MTINNPVKTNPVNPNIRVNPDAYKSMSKLEYGKFFLDHRGFPNLRTGADDINTVTEMLYVQPAETGTAEYVAGSEGRPKTIKEYVLNSGVDELAKLTTLLYEDPIYATRPTKISVELVAI